MDIRRGIPVSPGVAIGYALVLDTEGLAVPQRVIPAAQVAAEVDRLAAGLRQAAADARARERDLAGRLDPAIAGDIAGIFKGHADLFEHGLGPQVEALIRGHLLSAEYAVGRAIAALIRQLGDAGGGAFARIAADLRDVEKQLVRILVGGRPPAAPDPGDPVVVLAHDLTPSETAQFRTDVVRAFATESGGPTSHTAILAGALELPAVVGLGRFLADVSPGDLVVVDGTEGVVVIDPDPPALARYRAAVAAAQGAAARTDLEALTLQPAETKDGVRVALLGNIEFPAEAAHCLDRGAEGVGLYRTEFLYLNKTTDPTEDEHYQAYKAVAAAIGPGRPIVIRTLDIGADKFSSVSGLLAHEKNPFLGLRSVRLCLRNLPLFRTQLRAILRASVHGDVRVMFPMVSTVMELRRCRSLLREVQEDLEEEGVAFNPAVPVGTMVEVPSAALMADALAKEVDFFSVGTNDLAQYVLAADRNNENVAELYNPADPAVLRLIRTVVDAARGRNVEVNVCGEMSGEPVYAPLLVGLGLRTLSATPRKLTDVKRVLRRLTVPDAERIAAEALRLETAREVNTYLREQLRRLMPDAAD